MKPMTYRHILVAVAAIAALGTASAADRRIKITSRYLNFPISHSADRKAMTFVVDGRQDCRSVMRLTDAQPDYWTFRDVSRWRGKTITLSFDGPQAALDRVVAADTMLAGFDSDVLRISLTLEMTYATSAGLRFRGERIIDYDLNANTLNGTFYSPEEPGSMTLSADVYVDRRVVEVFADGGMLSLSFARDADRKSPEGYKLWGNNIKVRSLKVYRLNKK